MGGWSGLSRCGLGENFARRLTGRSASSSLVKAAEQPVDGSQPRDFPVSMAICQETRIDVLHRSMRKDSEVYCLSVCS